MIFRTPANEDFVREGAAAMLCTKFAKAAKVTRIGSRAGVLVGPRVGRERELRLPRPLDSESLMVARMARAEAAMVRETEVGISAVEGSQRRQNETPNREAARRLAHGMFAL